MSYADLIQRTREQSILFSVLVELTYSCNLRCFYCYNDRNFKGKPLTTKQYSTFFKDLRDMGVLHLVLSGGEPLMHPAFYTLGAKARELGFVIRIKSNGHDLGKESLSRIRAEIDPFTIDISLHGASANIHDRQTRTPGSFDCLRTNLDNLASQQQRFCLNLTLTSWNEHEVEQMFALAHSYNIPLNVSLTISPHDSGGKNPLTIIPSDAAIKTTLQLLRLQARETTGKEKVAPDRLIDCDTPAENITKICGTGSSTLAVDPFGNVLPCVQWRETAGSLHKLSIQEIWESSELLQKVRSINRQDKVITPQKQTDPLKAAYCPALARALTGNPLEVYSQAVRLRDALQNMK